MNFLCLGYGSIGKRHTRILREMGHNVVTVDPDESAGADCEIVSPSGWYYGELDAVQRITVERGLWDGVLDCTPADVRPWHKYGAHAYFVEKPLGKIAIAPRCAPVMMGFCYRWATGLAEFVYEVRERYIYSVSITGGQWLPDWHQDDYRARYHGMPGRGGVVLDSLPHSLYIAHMILNKLEFVGSVIGKLSQLEIETEDVAALLLRSWFGVPCYVYVDYLRRPRDFSIEIVHDEGVSRWTFDPSTADEMYQRQMEKFIELCGDKLSDSALVTSYWSTTVRYPPDLLSGIAVQRILNQVINTESTRKNSEKPRNPTPIETAVMNG